MNDLPICDSWLLAKLHFRFNKFETFNSVDTLFGIARSATVSAEVIFELVIAFGVSLLHQNFT